MKNIEVNAHVQVFKNSATIGNGDITLLPTNKCFDDALDFISELFKQEPDSFPQAPWPQKYMLVHGILTSKDDGHKYSHAWVETKEHCIDGRYRVIEERVVNGKKEAKVEHVMAYFDRQGYYKEMGVTECTKYTARTAAFLNHSSGYFGPWEKRYFDLCSGVGAR